MAKEDSMRPMKGIRDNSEDFITFRGLYNNKNLHEIDLSKPYFRKSTTNLFTQCSKEHPLFNDETLIKKSFSFSGTPCESESQKQSLQISRKNNTSGHRMEPQIDMETYKRMAMAEFERSLSTNTAADFTLPGINLGSQNYITLDDFIGNNILLSDNSANSALRKNNSLIPRRKIKNNATLNREPISKTSTNLKQTKSKLRVLQKVISKKTSNPDQAPKITSETLSTSNSRVSRKIPLKNLNSIEQITDTAPTRNKSRAGRKIPSKNTTSAGSASKISVELIKSRPSRTKTRFQNDEGTEKPVVNQSSISKASRPTVKKSTNKPTNELRKRNFSKARSRSTSTNESRKRNLSKTLLTKARSRSISTNESRKRNISKTLPTKARPRSTSTNESMKRNLSKTLPTETRSKSTSTNESMKRNLSKTFPITARSRSKSINTSTRRRSGANIPFEQPRNDESPTHVQPNNNPPTEPANVQFNQNTESNTTPNSEVSTDTNTSETTSAPDVQEYTAAPVNNNQADLPTNDRIENAPTVISNDDDEHFTSPSERKLNPDGDIRQSSPETRTQPIPLDPNSDTAAKHDLETWLRNIEARSDTPRPIKTSKAHPYPIFPVIRPCDKDLTSDPENCKKKLEQKLERMHKLKQAYYADPGDNIPFINLAYTKEGVFVDEPIENAFVYDDDFLKNNENSENYSRLSSGTRGNQSESVSFFSPGLKLLNDKTSASFTSNKIVGNKSSHSKWMDKILDETENNMMEDVLNEFQHKFNKLALNIQQASFTSKTSSNSEPVTGSKQRIDIPKRSSRSDK